jgi:hypothetical protein
MCVVNGCRARRSSPLRRMGEQKQRMMKENEAGLAMLILKLREKQVSSAVVGLEEVEGRRTHRTRRQTSFPLS